MFLFISMQTWHPPPPWFQIMRPLSPRLSLFFSVQSEVGGPTPSSSYYDAHLGRRGGGGQYTLIFTDNHNIMGPLMGPTSVL